MGHPAEVPWGAVIFDEVAKDAFRGLCCAIEAAGAREAVGMTQLMARRRIWSVRCIADGQY